MATIEIPTTRTADEWRAAAQACRERSAESFERCDTDGFLSQWASDSTARLYDAVAKVADEGGYMEYPALFIADDETGAPASTHLFDGEFGECWVLTDEAMTAAGTTKRFINPSKARKGATRAKNMRAKGFTEGRIRVLAGVKLVGNMTLHPVTVPLLDELKAGNYTIVTREAEQADWA